MIHSPTKLHCEACKTYVVIEQSEEHPDPVLKCECAFIRLPLLQRWSIHA